MWTTDQIKWRKTEDRYDKELTPRFRGAIYKGLNAKDVIGYFFIFEDARDIVKYVALGGAAEAEAAPEGDAAFKPFPLEPQSTPLNLMSDEIARLRQGITNLAESARQLAMKMDANDPVQKGVVDLLNNQAKALDDLAAKN